MPPTLPDSIVPELIMEESVYGTYDDLIYNSIQQLQSNCVTAVSNVIDEGRAAVSTSLHHSSPRHATAEAVTTATNAVAEGRAAVSTSLRCSSPR